MFNPVNNKRSHSADLPSPNPPSPGGVPEAATQGAGLVQPGEEKTERGH